jgi:uncharacterized protein YndB with AHSA1/START domain
MVMARAEASVVINRPLEEVFAFASNPENDTQWESGILELERTSEGPIGAGTTFRGAIEFMGRRIDFNLDVTRYEPNQLAEFKIDAGPLQLDERLTCEPVEGGTRVTVVYEGEPGGFFKVAEPIVVRMFQRQTQGNLAKLKDILEAG